MIGIARTAFCVPLLLLALAPVAPRQQPPSLADGIRLVDEGDFENALFVLDTVITDLIESGARPAEIASAYLHSGIAYLGLRQEGLAKKKFRRALRYDPALRLGVDRFAPRTIRVFNLAREEEAAAASTAKDARRGRSKKGLVLLGAGGAAAAGIALTVTTRERENSPPTASVTISPEGAVIPSVTRVTLRASATDADGDALSYTWTLGESGVSATGPEVTHVFTEEGSQTVLLDVRDGLATTRVTSTVSVRSLNGTWRASTPTFFGESEYAVEQRPGGAEFNVIVSFPGGLQSDYNASGGRCYDPRRVIFNYKAPESMSCDSFRVNGEIDSALETITGTLGCQAGPKGPRCACDGQERPFILVR